MRIYIAGPMTGKEDGNYPEFFRVADELTALGHDVENPAANDGPTLGVALANRGKRFENDRDYMKLDLVRIAGCDGIYLLDDWTASAGASVEQHISTYLGWTDQGVNLFSRRFLPEPIRPTIIGLCGYAQSGKDTVGRMLIENYGFERIAFADKVRDFVLSSSASVRSLVSIHGWEEAKKNPEIRSALQRCGMAGRNVLGENVWTDAALKNLKPGGRYVITDVRFPNEAQKIEDLDGITVRIRRPGVDAINGHISETALDGWNTNCTITNNSTFADLENTVDEVANFLDLSPVVGHEPVAAAEAATIYAGGQE